MNNIEVQIVSDEGQWAQVRAIREKVFIVGDGEPPEEQWDGNDYAATHLIAYRSGEAIGTMRIRPIDSITVMWERMALLPEARGIRTLHTLVDTAYQYTVLFKGYQRVLGIVYDRRLRKFWEKRGFRPTGEKVEIYRGHDYLPMERIYLATPRISARTDFALMPEDARFQAHMHSLQELIAA